MSNTLYFNVSGSIDPPNYQSLADDLLAAYATRFWLSGAKIEVRAYNMDDETPREERAYATTTKSGTWAQTANQVCVALSYYADRNLPSRRGRIYTGPWVPAASFVPQGERDTLVTWAQSLGAIGGVNVDWSVYSPTKDEHYRIDNVFVDNSWDIIRSRKLKGTARSTGTLNG